MGLKGGLGRFFVFLLGGVSGLFRGLLGGLLVLGIGNAVVERVPRADHALEGARVGAVHPSSAGTEPLAVGSPSREEEGGCGVDLHDAHVGGLDLLPRGRLSGPAGPAHDGDLPRAQGPEGVVARLGLVRVRVGEGLDGVRARAIVAAVESLAAGGS